MESKWQELAILWTAIFLLKGSPLKLRDMISEGLKLAKIHKHIVVILP